MRLAEGSEIPQCRGPTLGPTPPVVDVRLTRRHPTSRPHTGRMLCPYPSAHGCGRASPDGAGGNGAASVGDDVLPAAARLTGHGLPGDLGQDRAEPGQVTRLFTLAGEGADIGHDVDLACRRSFHRPGQCFAAAGEEIEEHVRLDLIQCSRVAFAPGLAGEPVDPLGRSHGQVGGAGRDRAGWPWCRGWPRALCDAGPTRLGSGLVHSREPLRDTDATAGSGVARW